MTLVTVTDVKNYLRLQHSAEDGTLAILLAAAIARITKEIGRPVVAISKDFTDPAQTTVAYGAVLRLELPQWPISSAVIDAPTIVDADGETVDPDTYIIDYQRGTFRSVDGYSFGSGPYTITAKVGLSAHPQYAVEIEPLLNGVIFDLVADDYFHRNPASRSESAAGGLSRSYADDDLPPRTKSKLSALKIQAVA